jgi:hypothetical protein
MALIHHGDYSNDLRLTCFDFFYWFSRFEFALKESGRVTAGRYNEALPDWNGFIKEWSPKYVASEEALRLLRAPPRRQVVVSGHCDWGDLNLDAEKTLLGKVVLALKTIRNNLFHGGKHGDADWDNPERNLFLLTNGKAVLDSLAELSNFRDDYRRDY